MVLEILTWERKNYKRWIGKPEYYLHCTELSIHKPTLIGFTLRKAKETNG
jgi:hypothetical protein